MLLLNGWIVKLLAQIFVYFLKMLGGWFLANVVPLSLIVLAAFHLLRANPLNRVWLTMNPAQTLSILMC